MEKIIEFSKVNKNFGSETVLKDSSFTINKGEFITILGTSGSGKTTTLKMINRLIFPDSGSIFFKGQEIETYNPVELRRHIGYVVQQIALFPHMTVEENISLVPRLLKWEKEKTKKRVKELLDLIHLPYDDYAGRFPLTLSGGQQQRIGVARALAADPDVMLFDEPFGAIDAITRYDLQEELLAIHKQYPDKTFIFITHDIQEAFKLGNRVMVMDSGKICQFDTPRVIFKKPETEFVKRLIKTVKKEESFWGEQYD